MIVFPNCKINLGLSVIEKRNDGFHNIESIFYPLPFHDILEVLPANFETKITVSGIDIDDCIDDNICVKAYNMLKEDYNIPPIKIYLHKNIPVGAGLGGGSSDGAFMLKALNKLFELNIEPKQMLQYASKLGSDCSFFINNKPCYVYKTGYKFREINLNLDEYFLAIVKPNISVSTATAYSMVTPKIPDIKVLDAINLPIENWKANLANDFEQPIFEKYCPISIIKEKLYRFGAIYASMSGSGSAVYGLFKNQIDLRTKFQDCFVKILPPKV